jgi:hypothetical protein
VSPLLRFCKSPVERARIFLRRTHALINIRTSLNTPRGATRTPMTNANALMQTQRPTQVGAAACMRPAFLAIGLESRLFAGDSR